MSVKWFDLNTLKSEVLECPADVDRGSLEVLNGLYGFGDKLSINKPRVLDIGGNVGAYTIWASQIWPDCNITCYEPSTDNFNYLQKNTKDIHNLTLHKKAVTGSWEQRGILFDANTNCGAKSLKTTTGECKASGEEVDCIYAGELGPADVIKLDTEGCELEILENWGHLPYCKAVALEYHSMRDRYYIGALLFDFGFSLYKDTLKWFDGGNARGEMLFYRMPK